MPDLGFRVQSLVVVLSVAGVAVALVAFVVAAVLLLMSVVLKVGETIL